MDEFLKELKEINPEAELVETASLGNISDYISTGSYALNAALTGDIFKGIPDGRVTSVVGGPSTGKSFIMANIIREAQKKGYKPMAWQTENASDKFFFQRLGVNTNNLTDLPVDTLEKFKNQAVQLIDFLSKKKEENPERKFLLLVDSYGNLMTEKEKENALAGHDAMDMGLRAKIGRLISRLITMPLARINVPMFCINHTYTNASGYQPIEVPVGGEGFQYISSQVVSLKKVKIKDKDTKELTGNFINALTTKNRLIPEGKTARLMVDFETGLNPYYGLIEYAVDAGLMEKGSTNYYVKHLDKKMFESKIYVPEVWEPILEQLNEHIKSKYRYSSISDDVLKVVEEGVEEVETETKPKRGRKKA